MTPDPKATPAIIPTDAEMDKMAQLIGLDFPVSEMQRIFARHQQDREKIATLEAENAELEDLLSEYRESARNSQ